MPNTKDISDAELHAKIALVGCKGVGKTTFFATMPGPRYMFNFEKENILPLKMIKCDMEYDDFDVSFTKKEAYEKFLAKLLEIKSRFDKGTGPRSICLDTGRDLQLALVFYIMGCKGAQIMSLPDWGLCHNQYYDRISDLLRLPCHVLINFHEDYDKDENTGKIVGTVALQGKNLPSDVLRKFNMLLHAVAEKDNKGEIKRLVYTQPDGIWPGDDKTGALDKTEELDFGKMWVKVQTKRAKAQSI